jgi:hypothetical protein
MDAGAAVCCSLVLCTVVYCTVYVESGSEADVRVSCCYRRPSAIVSAAIGFSSAIVSLLLLLLSIDLISAAIGSHHVIAMHHHGYPW